jgi:hypothetical protein
MKKLILFASVILLTISGWSQVTEGHISYKIDLTSDNPDMQSALSMMQGSMLDIYFMGQSTRAEMKMGSMMNVSENMEMQMFGSTLRIYLIIFL